MPDFKASWDPHTHQIIPPLESALEEPIVRFNQSLKKRLFCPFDP